MRHFPDDFPSPRRVQSISQSQTQMASAEPQVDRPEFEGLAPSSSQPVPNTR